MNPKRNREINIYSSTQSEYEKAANSNWFSQASQIQTSSAVILRFDSMRICMKKTSFRIIWFCIKIDQFDQIEIEFAWFNFDKVIDSVKRNRSNKKQRTLKRNNERIESNRIELNRMRGKLNLLAETRGTRLGEEEEWEGYSHLLHGSSWD